MPTYRITKPYTVKSRPIIFNGEMVRAILDGRKTQTRRVIKVEWSRCLDLEESDDLQKAVDQCPYGKKDDFLWVREGFVTFSHRHVENHDRKYPVHRHLPHYPDSITLFRVDEYELPNRIKWSSPIHIHKHESRISLRIVDIRVERVQEIAIKDAVAEGISPNWAGDLKDWDQEKDGFLDQTWKGTHEDAYYYVDAISSFRSLWDSINAKKGYGWDENPWVWVVEFERVEE